MVRNSRVLVLVSFVVVAMVVVVTAVPASGSLSNNEVYDSIDESVEVPPDCARGAVCGLVEVNAFGVSSVPLCSCPRASAPCPLVWDQEDGRSVTVGPKQYKFCHQPNPLRVCGRSEKAYVSAFYLQPPSYQILSGSHRLICYCPASGHHLVPAHTQESFEDGMLVISSVHTCNQLPVCQSGSPCKEISVADSGSQVEVKCRCPRPLVCPTMSREVIPHSDNYNRGSGYSVHCHLLF
ncbi:U-scoloptoxin(11)-Sm5a [Hyalella azteca]|uniref:U-scoloptoxin(11)-Sm5a n=1 Tax=Hyalella azteca TaxID=294128 RepID=A0A8B7PJ04_HYAAZ|nr:U-scoloptoxin(11)-Sm5a [Hyalella azteca]